MAAEDTGLTRGHRDLKALAHETIEERGVGILCGGAGQVEANTGDSSQEDPCFVKVEGIGKDDQGNVTVFQDRKERVVPILRGRQVGDTVD